MFTLAMSLITLLSLMPMLLTVLERALRVQQKGERTESQKVGETAMRAKEKCQGETHLQSMSEKSHCGYMLGVFGKVQSPPFNILLVSTVANENSNKMQVSSHSGCTLNRHFHCFVSSWSRATLQWFCPHRWGNCKYPRNRIWFWSPIVYAVTACDHCISNTFSAAVV